MIFKQNIKMQTKITKVDKSRPEIIEIQCHTITEEVQEIVAFVKSRQGQLSCVADEKMYEVAISDILYIEIVDNKSFVYTQNDVYETKQRLYELEEMLKEKRFIRISKSMRLNLMKVSSIKPALNSRFMAELISGEQVVITRKYAADLKKALKGEKV